MDQASRADLSDKLLNWFSENQRALPWRSAAPDPYAVWVSEIMLQQTTVAAVIGFYQRWMLRFPTVHALADAPLDDVLRHWAGLGYYARARNLHRAAQIVATQHGGKVPSNSKTLLALPGIGRYTAGAILSIAFNQNEPILDVNVLRVLTRLFAVAGNPKTSAVQAQLWALARSTIPDGRAGDFNQAMMELGALVCTPDAPLCDLCPVSSFCNARKTGDPTAFPQCPNVKKWQQIEDVSVAIFDDAANVLLVQRSPDLELWGGLWELPRATRGPDESREQTARRAACETIGVAVGSLTPFGSLKHVVANRKVWLSGFTSGLPIGEQPQAVGCIRVAWASHDGLHNFALSTPQRRLLAKLWQHHEQARLAL